ncbi:hypothetical protein [Mycetocola sp. 2940]|uniref:hypothetical protein n=1 Tax=Mycetocola sp. 2940 TaxID=3156452 RepID=UPI0033935953
MSGVIIAAAAARARLEPVHGVKAFRSNSSSAIASRAGQYLGMSAHALGPKELAQAVHDDSRELGIPRVKAPGPDQRWADQSILDRLTNRLTGASTDLFGRFNDGEYERDAAQRLWRNLSVAKDPDTLVALLNLRQHSDHDLEAVAAAAGLAILSGGSLELSNVVLKDFAESTDDLIRGIASAIVRPPRPLPPPVVADTNTAPYDTPVSTTIHGTWDLVTNNGWYEPRSDLHDHLRSTTKNLYDDEAYFIWSGEYSAAARAQGAADLYHWQNIVSSAGWIDTIYAHSHGGNVALDAAAAGQRIKMLVLLHTPAIHRPDKEWKSINSNVQSVIAMRTRMDLVVLADSLMSREARQKFDGRKLPHFPITNTWARREAWFSHSFFVDAQNWIDYKLAKKVKSRYRLIR